VMYHYDIAMTPPPTNLPILEGEYIEVGFSQPIRKANVYRTVYSHNLHWRAFLKKQ